MRTTGKAVLAAGGALLAAWVAWGVSSRRSTESVPYERVGTLDGIELRRYPPTVAVETTAPDQRTAFRRLFRYISGANAGEVSIPMTAPVKTDGGERVAMTAPVRSRAADAGENLVRMGFYLPREYGPGSAPIPTESDVELVTEPAKTMAVNRFSWYAPGWRVDRRERELLSTLGREGIEPLEKPTLFRYDDPWTPPFMRRNEVAVTVPRLPRLGFEKN